MTLASLCVAAVVLLWWWPKVSARVPAVSVDQKWTAVRGIRHLLSRSTSVQSFAQALAAIPTGVFDTALTQRLNVLEQLNREHGIAVTAPLDQLHFEADSDEILQRMWFEKSAVAYTSSNALIGLSIVLVIAMGAGGSVEWLLHTSIGRLCVLVAVIFTVLSRWSLRRAMRRALTVDMSSRVPQISSRWLAFALACVIVLLMPTALGVGIAIVVAIAALEWLSRLPSLSNELSSREIGEMNWLLALLQSSLASGLDWLRSLEVIHEQLQVDLGLAAVIQRLRWGLSADRAFSDERWSELAVLISQVQQLGVKTDVAFTHLRTERNFSRRSSRIAKLERVATKAVIPVSLLQLPAFVLIAIVPTLVVQFGDLFSNFLSTGS